VPEGNVRFAAKQRGQRAVIEWCSGNRRAIWWTVTGGRGRSRFLGTFEEPGLIIEQPPRGFSNVVRTS
jgi:hypothetical protein